MLATVIIITLTTILIVFISSIVYLVSLVLNDSDDDYAHGPALEFSSSPSDGASVATAIRASASAAAAASATATAGANNANGRNETSANNNIINEQRDKIGESAIHEAIRRNKLQSLIGLLRQHASEIDSKNELGETPLILACKVSNLFACQLLCLFDADVNAIDKFNLSARHYAATMCEKHRAAHMILAMLDTMNARRCLERDRDPDRECGSGQNLKSSKQPTSSPSPSSLNNNNKIMICTDGCSFNGQYNGNKYDRWTDYSRESLYKRHMFSTILESRKKESKVYRVWKWQNQGKEFKSKLLSIDGGGLRGVIVCQILIELQKHLKRPVISYFDWVGGTSVGAFIACALCQGKSLIELRDICFDVKDEVFDGQRPYNSKFIERVLKRTFTPSARMSDIKGRRLAVTTTLADRDPCQLRLFRNYKSPGQLLEMQGFSVETFNTMSAHSIVAQPTNSQPRTPVLDENETDPLVWQAVRASTAAPFFFKPYGPYLDGGIISNNPTLDLLHEFESYQKVREFLRKSDDGPTSKLDLVVSLGTGRGRVIGRQAMVDFNKVATGFTTIFSPVEFVRSIRAARDLFKKLVQQSCHTEDYVVDRAQAWCSSLGIPYFRINPPLATIFSIDDKRDEQLIDALWQTKLYMRSKKDQLDELAQILDLTYCN